MHADPSQWRRRRVPHHGRMLYQYLAFMICWGFDLVRAALVPMLLLGGAALYPATTLTLSILATNCPTWSELAGRWFEFLHILQNKTPRFEVNEDVLVMDLWRPSKFKTHRAKVIAAAMSESDAERYVASKKNTQDSCKEWENA